MNKRKNVWGFGVGLWALLLALWVAVVPLQAFAEEGLPEQEQFGTAEVELYQCGALPEGGLQPRAYGLSALETYLVAQFNNTPSVIYIENYNVSVDVFHVFYRDMLNAHPELFFVSGGYSYRTSGNIVTQLMPTYKYTGNALRTRQNQFNAELNRIVNYASKSSSTVGKLLLMNDYFCLNYQYDMTYQRNGADDLFIDKKGVCQAYMLGVRAVMNRLGIPCITATSSAMNHTWNMVQVNGSWYHLDVTWNDPIPDSPLRVCHNNFLLSDKGIRAGDHNHYGWTVTQTATNTQYDNFFWREVRTPMPMQGNNVYYGQINTNVWPWVFTIRRWTIGGGSVDVYRTNTGGTTYGIHPMQMVNGQLCFALGDKMYLLDSAMQTATLVYTHPSGHYIFSSLYENGQMRISAGSDYSNKKLLTVTLALPVQLTAPATMPAYGRVTMTVTAAGADAYRIYRVPNQLVAEGRSAVLSVACNAPGMYVATARVNGVWKPMSSPVTVLFTADGVLPSALKEIAAEAFMRSRFTAVQCPQGLTRIGARAFANCPRLAQVEIPASVKEIAADAFTGSGNVTLCGAEGSYAQSWAKAHGIPWLTKP